MIYKSLPVVALIALAPFCLYAQRAQPRGRAQAPRPASVAPPVAAPQGVTLSAQDMAYLVEGLGVPAEAQARLTADAAARKAFLHDVREMFAVAEAGRTANLAARPDVQLQFELSRAYVVARAYTLKRQAEGATTPGQVVSEAESATFLKEPGQEQRFAEFLQDYRKHDPAGANTPLTDAQLAQLKQNWVQVIISSRKGSAAGLDKERANVVAIMYQQARLLASAYFAATLKPQLTVTEPELDAYLAQHPELDPKVARAQIESVLQRARAGEDFAALARQFSSDPGSKDNGGDLGWFPRGMMVKPFEEAAFALKPGEISNVVESPFGFHLIKLEERRTQPGADGQPVEQVHARHILIAPGGDPGAQQAPREQARVAVEQAKQAKLIAALVQRAHINLPDDFTVGAMQVAPADVGPAANTPPTKTKPGAPPRGRTSPARKPARRP